MALQLQHYVSCPSLYSFHLVCKTPPTPFTSIIVLPPSKHHHHHHVSPLHRNSLSLSRNTAVLAKHLSQQARGGSGDDGNGSSGGGGGGGRGSSSDADNSDADDIPLSSSSSTIGILGLLVKGWKSRVAADPQLPFKLLMEELVGLTSCVLGDMASRPNFGLNELDFVFSTLVVAAIVNLVLMYVLAPTVAITTATASVASSTSRGIISSIFSSCPKGHMFESGAYSVLNRFGTFIYKGALFSVVGFAAGLLGTAVSNGLIEVRKKMDPKFETANEAPPTVLNALTWAAHMGLSCNVRYQTVTGVEFLLAKCLPPLVFRASIIVLRCVNNLFGGVSFVMMARLTGSQKPLLQQGNNAIKG